MTYSIEKCDKGEEIVIMNNELCISFHKTPADPGILEATGMQYHQYKW